MTEFFSDTEFQELDPVVELALIAEELRAYVKWQAECGATGVPRDPDLADKLKRLAEEQKAEAALQQSPPRGENPIPPPALSVAENVPAAPISAPRAAEPAASNRPTPASDASSFQMPDLGPAPRRQPVARAVNAAPAPEKRSLAVLGATLDELRHNLSDCQKCGLHETRKQTVFSRGTGSSGLCFVGEGPGADEDAQGEPFVGAAGQLLDKMIEAMGFSREEVYICNVVKCRPPDNRKPSGDEMSTCSPYLERQLELLNPQVIVALGGTAVEGLLGIQQGITRVRGKFRLYQGHIAVMPTFHPAYLLRNASAKRQVWTDLRQVVEFMGRKLPPRS